MWDKIGTQGHLIMSIVFSIVALAMILASNDSTIRGTGVGLLTTVAGYWFLTNTAKSVAQQTIEQAKKTGDLDK